MEITIMRNGRPVTYRLLVVRCGCSSHVVVQGFAVRECGKCGERCWA